MKQEEFDNLKIGDRVLATRNRGLDTGRIERVLERGKGHRVFVRFDVDRSLRNYGIWEDLDRIDVAEGSGSFYTGLRDPAIERGSTVILGKHRKVKGWLGGWVEGMEEFVGRRAVVEEFFEGGPLRAKVDVDGGRYLWRVRDMFLLTTGFCKALDLINSFNLEVDPKLGPKTIEEVVKQASLSSGGCGKDKLVEWLVRADIARWDNIRPHYLVFSPERLDMVCHRKGRGILTQDGTLRYLDALKPESSDYGVYVSTLGPSEESPDDPRPGDRVRVEGAEGMSWVEGRTGVLLTTGAIRMDSDGAEHGGVPRIYLKNVGWAYPVGQKVRLARPHGKLPRGTLGVVNEYAREQYSPAPYLRVKFDGMRGWVRVDVDDVKPFKAPRPSSDSGNLVRLERMDERFEVPEPEVGLQYYDTDAKQYRRYDGDRWVADPCPECPFAASSECESCPDQPRHLGRGPWDGQRYVVADYQIVGKYIESEDDQLIGEEWVPWEDHAAAGQGRLDEKWRKAKAARQDRPVVTGRLDLASEFAINDRGDDWD